MPTTEEKIAELEERLAKTKPNKATMKSIVTIKANIAKLRRELVKKLSSKGGGGSGFGVKKTGDAQVALLGFPSVGKSTLLNLLTEGRTDSKVAAYDFTTLNCIPGMMEHEKILIQLLDLPGIILGASHGRGRGREILAVLRTVDLIIMLIDIDPDGSLDLSKLDIIKRELHNIGIRINKAPPNIDIRKTEKGGIGIASAVQMTHLTIDYVKIICKEYKLTNAHLTFYEDSTPEDLIDAILGNCVYMPAFIVVNKMDLATPEQLEDIEDSLDDQYYLPISGNHGENIDLLKKAIYDNLNLIKIYLKPKGKEVDWKEPMILKKNSSVEDVCRKIHKDFVRNFRFAKVWGKSAKHPGQKVHLNHELMEGDVLTIFLKS
ncbi:MAG: OBG GTPase family GTP-binding protein [Candidatus Hodarchaeota archaeon]